VTSGLRALAVIVALKLMSAKQFLIFLIYLLPFTVFSWSRCMSCAGISPAGAQAA
jgi:hypothetical protein